MRITVLAGGIGAARFLRGLKAAAPDAQITVVGNTGDDITLFGLRVCPDLDTVMYTLGGGINPEQGWGRADESFAIRDELAAYGAGPSWFTLGDRDFATHILRTQLLATGKPLSEVTRLLCDRWQPGVRLLPMSDDRVETHVTLAGDPGAGDPGSGAGSPGGAAPSTQVIHFQEWWVRLHASVPAQAILPVGAAEAAPAPGVLDAISEADFVLFPPSNPVVSIGPILAVPGIRDATAAKTVVGVSGIIGGAPVRGMADACLATIGVETSAAAVAGHYGAGLLNGWLVDDQDKAAADDPACAGIEIRALPLYMRDLESTAAIARAAIDLALEIALCRLSRRLPVRFRAQSQSRQPSPSRVSPGCQRSALAMIWRHFSPARCSPMTALALPTATSSLSRRRWSARPRGGWSRPPARRPSRRRPRA
jgi:LPPG:FO 2-phospho-L-lactate transferase